MDIIQPSRKTRGCTWDGGGCVFYEIDSGQCALLEDTDHWKAEAARQLSICLYNFSAEQIRCVLDERQKRRQQEIHDEIWKKEVR